MQNHTSFIFPRCDVEKFWIPLPPGFSPNPNAPAYIQHFLSRCPTCLVFYPPRPFPLTSGGRTKPKTSRLYTHTHTLAENNGTLSPQNKCGLFWNTKSSICFLQDLKTDLKVFNSLVFRRDEVLKLNVYLGSRSQNQKNVKNFGVYGVISEFQ